MEFLIYIATGAFVGFFAGLLGIGGGLILVPVLTSVFATYMTSNEHMVHIAIGTSLATIMVTSLSSVRAHHKHDAVRWDLVKSLSPSIFIGGLLGGWISQFMDASVLSRIFAILEVLIAIKMLLDLQPSPHREMPGTVGRSIAGTMIGGLSSLIGIGGGALNTPYMAWHNVPMRQAIATSSACSVPVAISGTLGFIIAGWGVSNLPNYSTGFVYWPAFLGIVLASVFTAPLGAKMTHKLPVKRLKKIFGLLLIILAIKMFWH
ncbi:sulfite exporter TauE/SafE family protein [Hydrogenovibrio kuenenii]|uniref:sulfite exporter TauE/SafE family protein n=1 Tax=Hydrogenovibrio kuenenii TaxID=63658 RepID=UPI00046478B9|nr:sulfite exporter TauE/SafE family protein [Hydrogenovibrio kuenenii]